MSAAASAGSEIPDPFDPSSSQARYKAFAELRAKAGVHKLPTGQWFAVSHAAVETGLKNVDHFVGSFGDVGDLPEEQTLLAAIPEPRHGKIRRVVNSVFAYHHVAKIETFVRELAAQLMDDALAVQERDASVCLMETIARPLPSAVIAHVLGVPAGDFSRFARWSDEVLERQGRDDSRNKSLNEIHSEFSAYLKEQIDARHGDPNAPDDFTTRMLTTEVEGERLSLTAVRTQLMFLIIAGNETTRNLIGNLFARFARQPELYERVRADRQWVNPLVEESLRLDSPVQLLARTCTQPIELDGVRIEVGERVLFSVASANRDEKRFENPTEFRLDRDRPREHMGFGAGPHICPGAFLARLETLVAVETFLERVGKVALAPGY
jgi:cytochrome P450